MPAGGGGGKPAQSRTGDLSLTLPLSVVGQGGVQVSGGADVRLGLTFSATERSTTATAATGEASWVLPLSLAAGGGVLVGGRASVTLALSLAGQGRGLIAGGASLGLGLSLRATGQNDLPRETGGSDDRQHWVRAHCFASRPLTVARMTSARPV